MIQLRVNQGEKYIELGGGANPLIRPNVDVRYCFDVQGNPTVDFTADFNEPLPITSEEWDGVYCCFALEHISWRKVPQFLAEVHRILKPGGKAVFVIPNTEAQMKYILSKPEWDGDESCMLFGDLDYPENSHKAAFSPDTATKLFMQAGFGSVLITPYGELATDMVVEAFKFASPKSKGFKIHAAEEIKILGSVPVSTVCSGAVVDGPRGPLGVHGPEWLHDPGEVVISSPNEEVPPKPEKERVFRDAAGIVMSAPDDSVSKENVISWPKGIVVTPMTDNPNLGVVSYQQSSWIDDPIGAVTLAPPSSPNVLGTNVDRKKVSEEIKKDLGWLNDVTGSVDHFPTPRRHMFDRKYFDGGNQYGGYRHGYTDSPANEIIARKVLERKPKSVLELGCLVEDSPIITDEGILPIQDLREGMCVYSHEGQFSKISRMTYRPYDGEVISVEPRFSRGLSLRLTPDHPVYAVKVSRKFKSWKPEIMGRPEWVPAGELDREDHWLVIPRPKKVNDLSLDPDFARLCGYYLAEGWCQKKWNGTSTGYVVSFCLRREKYGRFGDDIRSLMKKYYGTTDGWIEDKGEKAVKLCFYSRLGYAQLRATLGQGARNKSIPSEWINGAPDDALRQLVLGMYRGDGTRPSGGRFSYKTTSPSMAVSLRLILLRFGIVSELSECPPRAGGVIGGKRVMGGVSYDVRVTGSHYNGFASILGHPPKETKDGRVYWYGRMDDDHVYIPIKKIHREHYAGIVYNMDVEEDHSYSHPVCTVHNCGRGYVLKRLQDAGMSSWGVEISKHCIMTRVTEGIQRCDLVNTPWPILEDRPADDLCLSVNFLEHVPEDRLSAIVAEMQRTCARGFHVIAFANEDDGSDKTRCTLKPREWWRQKLPLSHEIFGVHDVLQWPVPDDYLRGDGRIKLNIGSFTTMYHHGWFNIDVHDLTQWAVANRFHFNCVDVRKGLPWGTGVVDLIYCGHMLEHLTYQEGLAFLRECRRVIRPDGCMRIIVPDSEWLIKGYVKSLPLWDLEDLCSSAAPDLNDFDEINDGCAAAPTAAGKLWAMLVAGHAAAYDSETLSRFLVDAGFEPRVCCFRNGHPQILRETLDVLPCHSLYMEANPKLG